MLLVERGHAKNHVVIGHQPVHAADRGYWGAEVLVIRAAGVAPLPIIDDASAAIHPGAVVDLMGHTAPLGPALCPVLRDEHVVLAETALRRDRVAKAHHALARYSRVVLEIRRKQRRRAHRVLRLHQERHHTPSRLPGNARAVNPVPGHRVPARAVIHHWNRNIAGRRVDPGIHPVPERGLKGPKTVELCRDHHGLVGCGQRRRVFDFVNGGPGVSHISAVALARRAEVGRHGHPARRFQPIAVQT